MLLKQIKKILIYLFVILCIYVIYTNSKCIEPLSNVDFEVTLKPAQYYETQETKCRKEGYWKKKRRWWGRRWRTRTVCNNKIVKHNEDSETNEYVIEFDSTYTQISADTTSSYFDIYMGGLEPERYYTVLLKTTIDGTTKVFDEDIMFKVING